MLLAIGLFISVVFLSATLATAFILPSSHHVLHWRCQTYYVACLLVGDLLLAINQMSGKAIAGPVCVSIGKFALFLVVNDRLGGGGKPFAIEFGKPLDPTTTNRSIDVCVCSIAFDSSFNRNNS